MEAFLSSTFAVAIAEIGDKTQLLALVLAARYRRPFTIALGILLATLLNHSFSAWVGLWLSNLIPAHYFGYVVAASFILVAIWILVPDKDDDDAAERFTQYGVFAATLVLFFLAEMGDKTQIATVLLSAKYSADFISLCWVVVGTTLGMLLANVPVVYSGAWLMQKIPLSLTRKIAFAIFMLLGIATFIGALQHSLA